MDRFFVNVVCHDCEHLNIHIVIVQSQPTLNSQYKHYDIPTGTVPVQRYVGFYPFSTGTPPWQPIIRPYQVLGNSM